jgi:hypothetical protein
MQVNKLAAALGHGRPSNCAAQPLAGRLAHAHAVRRCPAGCTAPEVLEEARSADEEGWLE